MRAAICVCILCVLATGCEGPAEEEAERNKRAFQKLGHPDAQGMTPFAGAMASRLEHRLMGNAASSWQKLSFRCGHTNCYQEW